MIIPVRCFTCGKVIGNKWQKFLDIIVQHKTPLQAFQELKIERYCCRRMLLTHVNLIDYLSNYDLPREELKKA